ncbi:MAG: carbon-nitrogen hydrolase family protein [Pelistega sp.]|nr:carbon-nitrogen hydrolase family protein [Pelistega sp.]
MSENLRVGVAQFPASNDIQENKQFILQLVQKALAQGVELLVLPEASMCSFASELPVLRELAQQHSPGFIQFIGDLAQQNSLNIIVGVLSIGDDANEQRVSNQLLFINADGKVQNAYSKIHVYDAFKFKESDKVKPAELYEDGREFVLIQLKGFTIGLINCYDLRFPELARELVNRGADVLSVSANWIPGPYKEMHWDVLLRARAIENTSYVLASGQTAPKGVGQSMILDPMGITLAGCGEQVGVCVHDLSQERIAQVRELLPCLANRRLP